jgi:energy-converting hydrogenase Eha subunit F
VKELYLAELQRFRVWAGIAALLHVGMLGFLSRVVNPLQQPVLVYQVFGAMYALAGLLLGLYQMGSYRKPNTWLQLLHRPLPATQVGGALYLAAVVLLGLAIAMPVLVMVSGQAVLTVRVVDARHWLLPLAAWLIACCAYFAGSCAMLAARRWSALPLVLVLWPLVSGASGAWAILLQLVAMGWLACLAINAFKPDLGATPSGWREAVAALPAQMAAYCVLTLASLLYQLAWIASGTHPLNSRPPQGGYFEAVRAKGNDVMDAALSQATHTDTLLWREQARISTVYTLRPMFNAYPERGEITNLKPMEFDDAERRVRWTFSHDVMRFTGVNLMDRQSAGTLGIGAGNAPFPAVPLPLDDGVLVAPGAIYLFSERSGRITQRLDLPAGELPAITPLSTGESLAVLGHRELYFFDARAYADAETLLSPTQRLALPGHLGSLVRVDIMELLDGHLVSFLFGRQNTDSNAATWQELWRLGSDGKAERVARRALVPDFPPALRHYSWWLSPLSWELRGAAASLFAPELPLQQLDTEPRPPLALWLAGLLMGFAALGAWWLTARQGLQGLRRWLWVADCALFGVPALVTLRLPCRPRRLLRSPR